ncbi:hypothetical protein GPECTOR_43g935 [Gonium pectorale]|uniref:Uncharacterized protein n=1 Tax=Gonium pectorale TaxID=33097 RepID=A0A150G9J3_GONPE|nr:hypothetical protein GPECTOR_43g935 [Gonium pectorale]|eukprot:KXZ46498.1 hypothetical protein GPECTOR_43g935 [Gonium pectorale]
MAVNGVLSCDTMVLGGELVTSLFVNDHPWGPIVINGEGKIHYKSLLSPPMVEDTDAWKKKVALILGTVSGGIALLLGALYLAWRSLFLVPAVPTAGAGAALPASGGDGGEGGGQNDRQGNNENQNTREGQLPTTPGVPIRELARNGLEALQDVFTRGRTSGVVSHPHYTTSNPVYDAMPEWLAMELA